MGEWKQNFYDIINKEKYIGLKTPYYRSSWEQRFMYLLDSNNSVTKWSSESIKIPYTLDGKTHTYIPDFYFEAVTREGKVDRFIVEIKPYNQGPTQGEHGIYVPKPPKNNNSKALKRYYVELKTYKKNAQKWLAAKLYCEKIGIKFKVLTKTDIF